MASVVVWREMSTDIHGSEEGEDGREGLGNGVACP